MTNITAILENTFIRVYIQLLTIPEHDIYGMKVLRATQKLINLSNDMK
jgi:hypothetical protein